MKTDTQLQKDVMEELKWDRLGRVGPGDRMLRSPMFRFIARTEKTAMTDIPASTRQARRPATIRHLPDSSSTAASTASRSPQAPFVGRRATSWNWKNSLRQLRR